MHKARRLYDLGLQMTDTDDIRGLLANLAVLAERTERAERRILVLAQDRLSEPSIDDVERAVLQQVIDRAQAALAQTRD